jgi:hypothetical protein
VSGTSQPIVSVFDGTKRFDFYDTGAFREYLSLAPPSPVTLSPYLDEFKNFPQVDDLLITYFDECIRSAESGLRLAPSILMGSISELLIVKLMQTIGEYLEDPNAIINYNRKRTMRAKYTYVREMVRKGRERLEESVSLRQPQINTFTEFNNVVDHLFDSIRLRRNEYVHPKPETTLDDLPPQNVILANVQGFNPYAKVILNLIDIFQKAKEGGIMNTR